MIDENIHFILCILVMRMNNLQFFIFVFILSQDWPFNFFLRKHICFLKIFFFILKGMYTKSSRPLYYIEVCITQNFILNLVAV